MKSRKIYKFLMFGTIFICLIFPLLPYAKSQQKATKFEESMVCENEDLVMNNQWQWYKCIVEIDEKIIVTLSYAGDLDLDLKLYWKRENFPGFNGFDLSHCPIDKFNYSAYSQLRTTSTYKLGEDEELYFTNPSYTRLEDKEAFILVYTFSGIGKSEYVLEANHNLIKIEDFQVYDCNLVFVFFLIFFGICSGVFGLSAFLILRKKKEITRPAEEVKREEKKIRHIDLDSQT